MCLSYYKCIHLLVYTHHYLVLKAEKNNFWRVWNTQIFGPPGEQNCAKSAFIPQLPFITFLSPESSFHLIYFPATLTPPHFFPITPRLPLNPFEKEQWYDVKSYTKNLHL